MKDKDAELRSDLQYIQMYAKGLAKELPAEGKATGGDVGYAQRLLQLAEKIKAEIERRRSN